jgi:hypothetical protein
MRKSHFWALAGLVLLISIVPAYAQKGDVGIYLGQSFLTWNVDSWEADYPVFGVGYGNTYIPRDLGVWARFPVKGPWTVRIAGAYSFIGSGREFDQPGETIQYTDQQGNPQIIEMTAYNEEISTSVKGFFLEGAFLYRVPLTGTLTLYPGIGFGYVYQSYSGEFAVENEISEAGGTTLNRASGNFSGAKLAGLQQSFVMALAFRTGGRLNLVLEVSKLGFHRIQQTLDVDETVYEDVGGYVYEETVRETVATTTRDYSSRGGLTDLAVRLAVVWTL